MIKGVTLVPPNWNKQPQNQNQSGCKLVNKSVWLHDIQNITVILTVFSLDYLLMWSDIHWPKIYQQLGTQSANLHNNVHLNISDGIHCAVSTKGQSESSQNVNLGIGTSLGVFTWCFVHPVFAKTLSVHKSSLWLVFHWDLFEKKNPEIDLRQLL